MTADRFELTVRIGPRWALRLIRALRWAHGLNRMPRPGCAWLLRFLTGRLWMEFGRGAGRRRERVRGVL